MFTELILVGNVGRDPELRYTNSGQAVCDFSLAVNRQRRQGDNYIEETTWFRITVWGNQAETVNQYVNKGQQVLVVADRIEANAYMSREGQPRASLDVTARLVRFMRGSGGGGGGGSRGDDDGGAARPDYDDDDYDTPSVDDIPF